RTKQPAIQRPAGRSFSLIRLGGSCWVSTNRRSNDDRLLATKCCSDRGTMSPLFISLKQDDYGWNAALSTVGCWSLAPLPLSNSLSERPFFPTSTIAMRWRQNPLGCAYTPR